VNLGTITKSRVSLDIVFPLWEPEGLRIVTGKSIREFVQREPRSSDVMWRWVDSIESSNWRNPGDLRATFAAASFVGDLTVFNIGGNKYRIVAFVHFRKQIVYVKRIGTHKEYDK
jgi:mRNA interferase HigB